MNSWMRTGLGKQQKQPGHNLSHPHTAPQENQSHTCGRHSIQKCIYVVFCKVTAHCCACLPTDWCMQDSAVALCVLCMQHERRECHVWSWSRSSFTIVRQSVRSFGIERLPVAHGQISQKNFHHSWLVHQSSLVLVTNSHLVAKQGKYGEELTVEFCLRSISFTFVGFFYMSWNLTCGRCRLNNI
jgi:hypothetical protein